MKRLFTFVAAALMGLGVYAQTTTYHIQLSDADYVSGKEVRMSDRAAKHAAMMKMVDSIVAARTFRFVPQTVQMQPTGEMYPVNNAALNQNNTWYVLGPQMQTKPLATVDYNPDPQGVNAEGGVLPKNSADALNPMFSNYIVHAATPGYAPQSSVPISQPDFQVVFKPSYTDITLPYIIGVTPPYRNVLLNGVLPEVSNYKAINNEGGWEITFNSNVFTSNVHTFTLKINSVTRSATLTVTTPEYNPVVYMGNIAQL